LSASQYAIGHDVEYYAIRNSAAVIDVSPLFKYEIRGTHALAVVNRIVTRDVARCQVGQVMYTPWCDDQGKVIDDGTITRLDEARFRVTSAEPNFAWFQDCAYGFEVEIEDVSEQLAALAIQGPNSRLILQNIVSSIDLNTLRFYRAARGNIQGIPLTISRTGYTGDLGYELWVKPEHAQELWQAVIQAGQGYGLLPAGIVPLDIARIEAGLIMLQVDYISARKALIESQKSSPYEIGLGWAVDLDKQFFVGKNALITEKMHGSKWTLTGLVVEWESVERLYAAYDLAPQLSGKASRAAVPVYLEGKQIGQVTSHTFSPILKHYIGIGTVQSAYYQSGRKVSIELTVEFVRHIADAVMVKLPFFDPLRKRA
jgi:aminomethyltransferase